MSRVTHILALGGITVSAVLVTLVAADLAMRAMGFSPPVSNPWHLTSGGAYRVPDKDLVMINPRFLQQDYYAVNPQQKLIVTLGDSFTDGYPVADEYNYPAALKRLLRLQGCDVSLINMGLGDSGPDQHLRLMQKFVLPRLKPDIVIWQFYSNDIADNIRQAVYDIQDDALVPLHGHHWVFLRQRLFDAIPLPSSVKSSSPVVRLFLMGLEALGDRRIPRGSTTRLRAWSIDKIRLAINEMDRLSKIHGFAIYYLLVAPQSRYLTGSDHSIESDDVESYGQLREVLGKRPNFINAWFGDVQALPSDTRFRAPESAIEKPDIFSDERRDDNPLGDRHFNEIGYELLAEAVFGRVAGYCRQ